MLNSASVEQSRFARQMLVEPEGTVAGRYHAELSEAWNCPIVPHGGVVTALAASAMSTELDAHDQPLRSVTAVFAAPVSAGPVEIDARVLRRGRSMSQATATVRAAGEAAGGTVVAAFGSARPGFEFTDVTIPAVAPPEACPSFRDEPPEGVAPRLEFNFWQHVEGRPAMGHAPWEDYLPTTSERASWGPRRRSGCSRAVAPAMLATATHRSRSSCGTPSTGWWPTARR